MSNTKRLGLVPGQSFKAPVAAVSTSNITLSGTQIIASVSLGVDQRVLSGGQTDATENGIWVVKAGAWERASDFNRAGDIVNGVQVLDENTGGIFRVNFTGTSWSPGVTSLTVASDLFLPSPTVPASAADTGTTGQIAWDASYIYVCVATDTWKRVAIATW